MNGLVSKTAVSESEAKISVVEILAMALVVLLCDLTVFRGGGFLGIAVLIAVAPALLALGSRRRKLGLDDVVIGAMLIIVAAKLAWLGSSLLVAVGLALLGAFAMVRNGHRPFVLATVAYIAQSIAAGTRRWNEYVRALLQFGPSISRVAWLNVLLPLAALVVFGMIFILANPDLLASFSNRLSRFLEGLRDWLLHVSWTELLFCASVAWISVGLMHPLLDILGDLQETSTAAESNSPAVRCAVYPAFRNTLIVVIVLFGVYLGFEFQTLWIRQFPKGFHYSGYAHRGAAWLTIALALATLLLSIVFRGSVLNDPRLSRLKHLAWVWSALNGILAVAVFHRLFIYIDFNGLTRMRIVGLFGTTTVIVGFVLVLWKITHRRDFVWLVRRQLWAVSVAIFLFSALPIDAIWVRYNVRRIMAGDPAPCVEISVHPISADGAPHLLTLVGCNNPKIAHGVRALLREWLAAAERHSIQRAAAGWSATQRGEDSALQKLRGNPALNWPLDASPNQALEEFHRYAYQWY